MCLIALAWRARTDLPLVVAANRDEWRDRPAQRAHWWPDHPDILAGRDLQAGGTWMGITRGGRFAAVTNFRDPSDKRSTARSRGGLVTGFLLGTESPARFLAELSARAGEYNGFNLVLGDGDSLFYYGSREGEPRAIEPGVHGLSNHLLDEPWPKVVRARERMGIALALSDPTAVSRNLQLSTAVRQRVARQGFTLWTRRRAGPLRGNTLRGSAPPVASDPRRTRCRSPATVGSWLGT